MIIGGNAVAGTVVGSGSASVVVDVVVVGFDDTTQKRKKQLTMKPRYKLCSIDKPLVH